MAPFGTVSYAREELIAEMGAAFLCGRAGIDTATLENSAAYINGWLEKLRKDPKVVVIAAASAQKAADYILCVDNATANAPTPTGLSANSAAQLAHSATAASR